MCAGALNTAVSSYFGMSLNVIAFIIWKQREEPEGEIDLSSCTDIIETDVEKNYGFQFHVSMVKIVLKSEFHLWKMQY